MTLALSNLDYLNKLQEEYNRNQAQNLYET